MRYNGVTSKYSIVRQAMTILGHDKITNIDDLKLKEDHSSYPTAIYTMNLLQAGGFNTKYYRNREGTQETVNKTAFVMASGHHQALDCTTDPAKYGIILKACEHDLAKACLKFKTDHTEDQACLDWLPGQDPEVPDQNVAVEAQRAEAHRPVTVSVITGTGAPPQPPLPPPSPPPSSHKFIKANNRLQPRKL